MRSLAIGATGMLAQQTNVDVISNNIANMNTTAYTKRRAEFNDLLYQNIILSGSDVFGCADSGSVRHSARFGRAYRGNLSDYRRYPV